MSPDRESGGGGMTGATGDLTPDAPNAAFEPGERREVAGADAQADVTVRQAQGAPSQAGDLGEPGSDEQVADDPAPRDAGYGSEHGLSPEDPAYRMQGRPRPDRSAGPPPGRETRIGGDEVHEEEDRF